MAGLKDIATNCNVSSALVSRILNYDKSLSVTDEVRAKVLAEAERLGYLTPRQRRERKNFRIALVLAPIDRFGFENAILDEIAAVCPDFSMTVEFYKIGQPYDGMIILGEFPKSEIDSYASVTNNLLLINNRGIDDYSYDTIMMDYEASERMLLDHLCSDGKKTIGYYGGIALRDGKEIGRKRSEGFRRLLEEIGIFDERFFHVTKMEENAGYEEIMNSQTLPQAIIFSDADYARGALRAIRERKIDVYTVCYENYAARKSGADLEFIVFSEMLWKTGLKFLSERIKRERAEGLRTWCPAHFE